MKALLAQPISKLDQVSAGTVSNTITASANSIQLSVSDRLSLLFNGLALLVAAYIIAFIYSWQLTLVVSSALLFIIVVYSFTTPVIIKLHQAVDKADAKHASIAGEIFASIRTVLSLGAEAPLSKNYFSWVGESRKRGLRLAPMFGVQIAPLFFSMYASFALAFWYGLKLYREGHIGGIRTVVTVIFSILMVVSILGNIVQPITLIVKAISASSEFFDMMDAKRVDSDGLSAPEANAQDDIKIDNIHFSYPTRKDVPVLKGFNAHFQRGKTTALVGPSGSGKSTIVALLERWYNIGDVQVEEATVSETRDIEGKDASPPGSLSDKDHLSQSNSGTISCGNHNIQSFNLKWWRTQIGLVQQEPFLFNDTILNNVSFGLLGTEWQNSDDATKLGLVEKACQEAFADEFIKKLPEGYSTQVGESGIKLSGGQRQRIAIARSIVRNPRILILDEATSSIDVRGERIVQDALDRVSKDRTTIVIAHRLATIKKADHIIVMRDGCNIEEGTHEELIGREDGLYCGLVTAQQLGQRSMPDYKDEPTTPTLQAVSSRKAASVRSGAMSEGADIEKQIFKVRGFFATVGRFLFEQRRYWALYALALLGIMGAGAAFSMQAYLFAQITVVFRYTGSKLVHEANFWSLMFFILSLGMLFSYLAVGFASTAIATHVGFEYRSSYFSDIVRQNVPFFDAEDNSSGALMSKLSTDPKNIQELLGITGALPSISVFNLIGCVIISFYYGWKLTLVAFFAVMPVLLGCQFLRMRYEINFQKRNSAVFSESSTFATEAIAAMRTVVSLTMEDTIIKRYETMLYTQIKAAVRKASYNLVVLAFADSVGLLCMALTFWYGGQLLASHEYNSTQFFVIYIAIVQGSEGAGQFFALAPNLAQATASGNRILDLRQTDVRPDTCSAKHSDSIDSSTGAALELSRLTFRYPTRPITLFHNLSMSIPAGAYIAFVGPSGCGKTSIVSLLERFYLPTSGTIILNGIDISTLPLPYYRSQISLVAQEPKLFEGTIHSNLLLGVDNQNVSEEEIEQACRDAEIHDFIISLPDGYGTELGINTSTALSGGQKQRLCLARALLRKPKLLLLDEATSSLDSQSEKLVQTAIERLAAKGEMTVIAVAHRLSTVQKADVIYVFGEGEEGVGGMVVEKGGHEELCRRRGVYWGMCQAQALDR